MFKNTRHTLLFVAFFTFLVLTGGTMGCTRVQIQDTLREHKIIVRPGNKIRPRAYETGDGDIEHIDTAPQQGDTLMIIIRGKM